MRFLADHMLGSLARWLRFFGFDTAYPDVLADKDVVELAKKENRIILTRDKELAQKKDVQTLYLESTDLDGQLTTVFSEYKLKIINAFSRCSLCNSILVEVEKKNIKDEVPDRVYSLHEKFWECKVCQKYYWQGTHYQKIEEKIRKINR